MLNVFKGKIAILLVVSMVFSNAGMMTFASSVDDAVSAASIANGNNTHNYYEGNILKDKIEGDDVGASDFVVASYASSDDEELDDVGAKLANHDDEEPEEDATIESSDNDESDSNDFYESTVENSESIDSIDSSENSEDIFESDKSESNEINKVEEGDLTSAGIEDGTIDSINESERVDDSSTSPNEDSSDPNDDSNFVETSNSVGAKHREPEATTSDIAPSEDQNETDEEKLNNDVATNSDADEKDKVNINLSTVSEVANNNLIATDSEFSKPVLDETLSTASEALEVNESTKSDIILLEEVLSTKSSTTLFGDTEKYILPANWTDGSGITKKRIDKIEILYYGKDAPTWYNISWNIEGSNGLRAYKQSSYIYIFGHQKIKISI